MHSHSDLHMLMKVYNVYESGRQKQSELNIKGLHTYNYNNYNYNISMYY